MTSPFHGAALQQLRSKVLAPGATTGHALVAVLGAGTLERGLGQSLERGLPWSIIWVLGEWDIYIYTANYMGVFHSASDLGYENLVF